MLSIRKKGLLMSLLLCNVNSAFSSDTIAFSTVHKSAFCGVEEASQYVVNSSDEFKKLQQTAPQLNLTSEPSFRDSSIIAVFLGLKSTGGYAINVEGIVKTASTVQIIVNYTKPARDTMVTQVLTTPCHIIKTEKIEQSVEFIIKDIEDL